MKKSPAPRLAAAGLVCGIVWVLACAPGSTGGDLVLPGDAPKGLPPLESFVSAPRLEKPKLSPNGRYVASIRLIDGYRNLVKTDLESGETTPITAYRDDLLFDFWWANDERLLLSVSFKGNLFRRLLAVNLDGSEMLDFAERIDPRSAPPEAASRQFGDLIVSLLPHDRENVLIGYAYFAARNWVATSVYRLNVYSGRTFPLASSKANPYLWLATDDGEVRVGAGARDGKAFFVYRESRDADCS
jgi:hypothetical protein